MARKTSVFISFQHDDVQRARGFRLLNLNPHTSVDFVERSFIEPMDSKNDAYIERRVKEEIAKSDVVVVLVGKNTAESRWVPREIKWAEERNKGVIGIHVKGQIGNEPKGLDRHPVMEWKPEKFQEAIQRAAAQGKARRDALATDSNAEHCG